MSTLAEFDQLLHPEHDLSPESATGPVADAEHGEGSEAPPGSFILDMSTPRLLTKGIRKRRSAPICGYVGLNGHGKSAAMIRDTLPTLAGGGKVLSTVVLLDPHTGNPHPAFTRLERWSQLLNFRYGDLLLDEVTGVMDARDQGMPKHIRRHIHQLRRSKVQVRWTGIDWDNVDRRMRQITQAAVHCRGHFPNRDGSDVQLWAPNRAFMLTTFDAQTLKSTEDSAQLTTDSAKKRRARVLNREFVVGSNPLTGTSMPAFSCYDTMDSVSWVDNACLICGGKPVEKSCRGHDA